MTTDFTSTEQAAAGTPGLQPESEGATNKRPVAWMIIAGVAVVASIGLGALR